MLRENEEVADCVKYLKKESKSDNQNKMLYMPRCEAEAMAMDSCILDLIESNMEKMDPETLKWMIGKRIRKDTKKEK